MNPQTIFALLLMHCVTVLCSSSSSLPSTSYDSETSTTSTPEQRRPRPPPPMPVRPPPPQSTSTSIYFNNFVYHRNSTVMMEDNINIQMAPSVDQFATNIYEAIIAEKGNGNSLIMSPFSVQTALSLLYCGAEGNTATTMQSVLQLADLPTVQDVANNFYYLLLPFENNGQIRVANGIFVNQEYALRSNYQSIADHQFFSTVNSVNFGDNVAAAQTINDYVTSETGGKITDLVSSGSFTEDTGMVIVNAIAFNGCWESPFSKEDTVSGTTFYTSNTTSTSVDMMHSKDIQEYYYMQDIGVKVVLMDYKNSEMSMVVFLPDSYDGLVELESNMATFNYTNIVIESDLAHVTLSLPKFEIDFGLSLKKTLKNLGLEIMFDKNAADFTGLLNIETSSSNSNQLPPLYVSDVIHKAHIKVDEKGTVAAAATAVEIGVEIAPNLPPMPKEVFNADHPFAFALINQYDVIFIGRYVGV